MRLNPERGGYQPPDKLSVAAHPMSRAATARLVVAPLSRARWRIATVGRRSPSVQRAAHPWRSALQHRAVTTPRASNAVKWCLQLGARIMLVTLALHLTVHLVQGLQLVSFSAHAAARWHAAASSGDPRPRLANAASAAPRASILRTHNDHEARAPISAHLAVRTYRLQPPSPELGSPKIVLPPASGRSPPFDS